MKGGRARARLVPDRVAQTKPAPIMGMIAGLRLSGAIGGISAALTVVAPARSEG